MKICVVGQGEFGNAIVHVLRQNTQEIFIAKRGEIIDGADIVVLCVPTQSIRDVLSLIHFPSKKGIIVNTAKGIEQSTHKFPYQIVEEMFGDSVSYYSLMGPSFASEMLKDMPTLVNIGYREGASKELEIQKLFQTDTFRVRMTKGVEVLEIASAMKNIYAIGCGIADGLGYGENTQAKLLILAIEEMEEYFRKLKLHVEIQATAGTIGDLILTCASHESRNFRFGKYLLQFSTDAALQKVQKTVEGYSSLLSLPEIKKEVHTALPLATFIAEFVLGNKKDPRLQFDNFLKTT